MPCKPVRKNAAKALFWTVASLILLLPTSLEASIVDLEKLSASGTLRELEAVLAEVSADVVFPSGNGPLHIAAEHASDPAVIDLLIQHGASISEEGL